MMKLPKQWVFVTGITCALICALLAISSNFTNKAKAGPIYSVYLPVIFMPPMADLTITINDGVLTYTPGGTTTYTVVVNNGGPANINGAIVTVTRPGQISSWTVTCVPVSPAVCTHGPISPGGNITDQVDIPAGKKVTYTIVAHISGGATGSIVTTASVTSPGSTLDPNLANNSASDTDAPPSAVSITDVPDPSTPGQTVVVGVTVSGAGLPVPSGTVEITGADANCTITLNPVTGSGSCGVIFNTTGHKTITAAYSGDLNYAPSSGIEGHIVEKGTPTIIITAHSPNPSTPGQAVLVSFSVIGGGVTPTGRVDVTGADVNCSTPLSGGAGSCTVKFNTWGDKTITATYNGDDNYLPSVDTEPHQVRNATTTKITSVFVDPSTPGQTVTVNFTVSGDGVTRPTGNVSITGADFPSPCTVVGIVADPINSSKSSGSCVVRFDTAGAKILQATYDPLADPNYAGSTGWFGHTVNKGDTQTTIVSIVSIPPGPFLINHMVRVTVTVANVAFPLGAIPTGTVAITTSVPSSSCTLILDAAGTGYCDLALPATVGTYTYTATYSGDQNYLSSVFSAAPIIVN